MPPPSGKARRRAANAAGAAKPVAEGAPAPSDPPRRRPPPSPRPSRTGDASSLVGITCFVAAPYGAWLSYYWLHLQSGLLRAPVGPTQPRQLLVVAIQSSGTTSMSAALAYLGLEVAHDTQTQPLRSPRHAASLDRSCSFAACGLVGGLYLRFLRLQAE